MVRVNCWLYAVSFSFFFLKSRIYQHHGASGSLVLPSMKFFFSWSEHGIFVFVDDGQQIDDCVIRCLKKQRKKNTHTFVFFLFLFYLFFFSIQFCFFRVIFTAKINCELFSSLLVELRIREQEPSNGSESEIETILVISTRFPFHPFHWQW